MGTQLNDKEIEYFVDAIKNTPQYYHSLTYQLPSTDNTDNTNNTNNLPKPHIELLQTNASSEIESSNEGSECGDTLDPSIIKISQYRQRIVNYLAHDWIDATKQHFPLDSYVSWPTWFLDMCRLSREFPDVTFNLYGKGMRCIDDLFVKIFRAGDMLASSTKVHYQISLIQPDGSPMPVNQHTGLFDLPPDAYLASDQIFNTRQRDLLSVATSLVGLGIDLYDMVEGGTKFVAEISMACSVIAAVFQTVQLIQQYISTMRHNSKKCRSLAERCQNLLNSLQGMPVSQVKLGVVISVFKSVTACCKFIESYAKQWMVRKFLGSYSNQREFNDLNDNLSNSLLDLVASYQINRKNFET